jgi:phosphatidylglycerophosphate synthase
MDNKPDRRPLATRSAGWAQWLAARLAATAVTPNQISCISIVFAAAGAALLVWQANSVGLVAAAVCVQLRLLCNLLDGMVAIEGGKQSPLGGLYNELPDRFADSLLLVALGYAAQIAWLGWLCALAAALTAYIRVFGGAAGLAQDFSGVMSKPRRMATLTLACLLGALELPLLGSQWSLRAAAAIIAVGTIITCITRTRHIAAQLQSS